MHDFQSWDPLRAIMVILLFTPYTYIFLSMYSFFMVSLFTQSSFYSFWLSMELMTLLMMGVSYTLFTNSVSQLMVYFLVQSLSSFIILVAFMASSPLMLTFAFLMKFGMFPFLTWYLNVVTRFPNFIFWLVSTLHKLPPLLLLLHFNLLLVPSLFWAAVLVTTLFSGGMMLMTFDFRWLLVASSVGNNSWFLFSEQVSYPLFLSFILIYSFFLGAIVASLGQSVKPVLYLSPTSELSGYRWWFLVMCVSGLPPFPLFFLKMSVIYSLFTLGLVGPLFVVFLLFNALMVAGYLNFLMKFGMFRSTSVLHYSL